MCDNSSTFCTRRNSKAVKALEAKCNYVLGRDVYMDKVEALCYRALVGRLEYYNLNKKKQVEWDTIH